MAWASIAVGLIAIAASGMAINYARQTAKLRKQTEAIWAEIKRSRGE